MDNRRLNIMEFMELLNFQGITISPAQRAILKSFYGLPLEPIELDIFLRGTGRRVYIPRAHDELSLLAGRQSGKTSVVAALIALYEAFRDHGVPPGQLAYVFVVAPVIQQAMIAFNFIRRYILESPILAQYVCKITKLEIEFARRCCYCVPPLFLCQRPRRSGNLCHSGRAGILESRGKFCKP